MACYKENLPLKLPFCGFFKIIKRVVWIRLNMRWWATVRFSYWASSSLNALTDWGSKSFRQRLYNCATVLLVSLAQNSLKLLNKDQSQRPLNHIVFQGHYVLDSNSVVKCLACFSYIPQECSNNDQCWLSNTSTVAVPGSLHIITVWCTCCQQ